MKKIILAAVLLTSTAAFADDEFRVNSRCYGNSYVSGCKTVYSGPNEPIYLTPEERAAQEAEIAKWEAFCKPTKRQDALGVYRFVYAHKGCDLARSE